LTSQWVHANDAFHDVFLEASGVRRLAVAARSERRVFYGQTVWSVGSSLDELYSLNVEQHRAIADAFAVRSQDVRDLVERHILDSGRLLEQSLENAGYNTRRLSDRVSWTVKK
jgi:DNA-binding GntR family transcriptional regulator